MERKSDDVESYPKTKDQEMEKELDHTRKVNKELEMDHLISQIENGRSLDDLSQTEKDDLRSYKSKKITFLERLLGTQQQHPSTSVINEPILGDDDIPKAADVAPEGGPSFHSMGRESAYFMDNWFFGKPKVLKHGDGTHLTTVAARFDLNMEPSDDDDDEIMKTYEGQSSKSGGADKA